jgi:microsomal dipeptidase-like Zn-dependent dipeptidase
MLVDLHAHYPMHVLPEAEQGAHAHLRRWRQESLRAAIVRFLSRFFNYQAAGDEPGVTLEQMREGRVGVIFSALYSPFDEIDLDRRYGAPPRSSYFTHLIDQLESVEADIAEHRKKGEPATIAHSPRELADALTGGAPILIHSVEGGFHLGDSEAEIRENVRKLAQRGVVCITVAHLFWRGVATNAPALPFMPDWLYSDLFPQPKNVGLSDLGRAAVNAMLDHGILVDVTHMSELAIEQTLDLLDERDPGQRVPVLATHMACRFGALEYNLTDETIARIAKRKGLLGLIACEHYISDGARKPKSFEDSFELLCRHIDRIREVTRCDDCVAFGSDLDGYIKPALHGIKGLAQMESLQQSLVQRYGEDRAAKFAGANALRILATAWQVPLAVLAGNADTPAPAHNPAVADTPARAPLLPAAPPTPPPPSPPPPDADAQAPQPDPSRAALDMLAFAVGFLAYLYAAGWVLSWARLSAARLPVALATDAFSFQSLVGGALRSTALTAVAFAVLCLIAYLASARRWKANGPQWHAVIRQRGVGAARSTDPVRLTKTPPAPLGEGAVRVIAGFNVVVLATLIALGAVRLADALFAIGWLSAVAGVLGFLLAHALLTRWGPLKWHQQVHGGLWLLVAVGAMLASAPIGLLLLVNVLVSTFGRVVARLPRPGSIREWTRSPLPWALLAILTVMGAAYQAIPPVSFPRAVLNTTTGRLSGGYVSRTGAGVYLASCTSLANATSTDERLALVPAHTIRSLSVTSEPYRLDSGQRPSLLTLALHEIDVEDDVPTLFSADLRSRGGTCGGEPPTSLSHGSEDPALGAGVITGPAPPEGRASDGEAPIEDTSSPLVAELARRYQPTLEVSVADRFWPVSVGAVLAERGPNGATTCLVQRRAPQRQCEPSPTSLQAGGASAGDYLQLPVALARNSSPNGQFQPFMLGQGIETGTPDHWLADPGTLDPWSTAQIYFYLDEKVERSQWPKQVQERYPRLASGLVALEYWFYYPYNYFPLVVRTKLMEEAPLASEILNVDRHQGDWEHIDVLLDPHTLEPQWLYMARHSYEGQLIPWSSPSLATEAAHPVVQAAYGGHPTYEPGCGARRRAATYDILVDWLVCGGGRFAFRAASTPLVNIASAPWACWPGHFGEAVTNLEIANAAKPETLRDKLREQVFVAGPVSPLRQQENSGVCNGNPAAGEQAIAKRLRPATASPAGR